MSRVTVCLVLGIASAALIAAPAAAKKKKPEKSIFDDCPVSETVRVASDASIEGLESLSNCDDVEVSPADPEDMRVMQTRRIKPRMQETDADGAAPIIEADALPQGKVPALHAVMNGTRTAAKKRERAEPGIASYGKTSTGGLYVRIAPRTQEMEFGPQDFGQNAYNAYGAAPLPQLPAFNAATRGSGALTGEDLLAMRPVRYRTTHDDLIAEVARRHRVDPLLLHAVIKQESGYKSVARSYVGARGLMQIMPGTGALLGVDPANLWDPATNVDAGARLLRKLAIKYNGDFDLVLAAYNAGEGAVKKYGYRIPPYRETQDYVRKVMGHYNALFSDNLAGTPAK